MTPEEYGAYLLGRQQAVWADEWALKDDCLELVKTHDEGFVRQVAHAWGVSHRWIYKNAALAEHFPAHLRSEVHSARTHASWKRHDESVAQS